MPPAIRQLHDPQEVLCMREIKNYERKVPRMTTDQEADAFLEQDLSDLDFSQFKPVKFEFQTKAARSAFGK
jgi:predicted DNA binding CopG/RHH family protein